MREVSIFIIVSKRSLSSHEAILITIFPLLVGQLSQSNLLLFRWPLVIRLIHVVTGFCRPWTRVVPVHLNISGSFFSPVFNYRASYKDVYSTFQRLECVFGLLLLLLSIPSVYTFRPIFFPLFLFPVRLISIDIERGKRKELGADERNENTPVSRFLIRNSCQMILQHLGWLKMRLERMDPTRRECVVVWRKMRPWKTKGKEK